MDLQEVWFGEDAAGENQERREHPLNRRELRELK